MWEDSKNTWSHDSLQIVKKTPYLLRFVPEKRNKKGELRNCPEYFFLLTTIHNRRICCFIEKKKPLEKSRIFQARFRFKDELFEDTLLSGYLTSSQEVRSDERVEITEYFSQIFTKIKREVSAPAQNNNWLFIANDIWIHSGNDVSSVLSQRIVNIQDIIGKHWFPDSKLDVCDFDMNLYNNYNNIENFLKNNRKYFPYDISSHKVVFVSTQGIPGVEEYLVSLTSKIPKPSQSETVVFRNGEWNVQNISHGRTMSDSGPNTFERELYLKMSDFPDVYWVHDPKSWKKLGAARVKTIEGSQCLKKLFKGKDHLTLNFVWAQEFEKWQPVLSDYL
jgi:hypothetical protein